MSRLEDRLTSYLPWVKSRVAREEKLRKDAEAASLYRFLGVHPGTDYASIVEHCKKLEESLAGDRAAVKKVRATKQAIIYHRFKQKYPPEQELIHWQDREPTKREDGGAGGGESDEERLAMQLSGGGRKLPMWLGEALDKYKPEFTKGLIEKPDRDYLQKSTKYLGGCALGCFFVPKLVTTFMMLGAICSLGMLQSRGLPPLVLDENGNPGEVRKSDVKTTSLLVIVVFGNALLFAALGGLVGTLFPVVQKFATVPVLGGILVNTGFWVAATFFQINSEAMRNGGSSSSSYSDMEPPPL
jgi:hypothetical protein